MQPVKITIVGRFWDSQIYKGRLYLFDLDGSLRQVNWNSLVDSLRVPDRCRLALECAFQRSDYLYGNKWDKFYHDLEVSSLLENKFSSLIRENLLVDTQQLSDLTEEQGDSPFPFAHNDSLCYRDHLYATSQSGVYSKAIHEETPANSPRIKLWDAPVGSLDVSLDILALAAGDAGLFRSPTVDYFDALVGATRSPEQVWPHLCNDCNYISSSILAFGHDYGTSLVEFRTPKRDSQKTDAMLAEEFWKARPIGHVEGEQIFRESTAGGVVWGSKLRMCMAKDGELHVTEYMTTNPRRRNVAKEVRRIRLSEWKGSPVAGDNAVFGAILELDNALVVVRSDDKVDTLQGEPTNWRVFPRSKYYVNQLHVIYDDRIEILSYNHDYFVNQRQKSFGEPHIEQKFRSRDRSLP